VGEGGRKWKKRKGLPKERKERLAKAHREGKERYKTFSIEGKSPHPGRKERGIQINRKEVFNLRYKRRTVIDERGLPLRVYD